MQIRIKRESTLISEDNGIKIYASNDIVGELSDSDIVAIVERYKELYISYQDWLESDAAKRLCEGGYNLPSFPVWVEDWNLEGKTDEKVD